jgi:hypothetical protein
LAQLAILVAVLFVGVYWLGCIVLRPVFRQLVRTSGRDNEIVGSLLAAFGVLYGLLLSLIAVGAYQSLNLVESQTAGEATAMLALHRDVAEYPSPLRERLQANIRKYCRFIIDEEWPLLREGVHPVGATPQTKLILEELLDLDTDSRRDEVVQTMAIGHYESMVEFGRHRRFASTAAIPTVMWYVVIVGAIINYGLMWSFEMRFITQLFLGGLLAFFLGALILMLAVLDRPYRSREFGVTPQAFSLVYEVMQQEEQSLSTTSMNRPEN